MKVTVVSLEKGGVGKTTTAMHVAHGLARLGRQVLLIDLDPQGSLSKRHDTTGAQYDMSHVLGVGGQDEVRRPLADAVIPTQQTGLFLAPCNKRLADSADELDKRQAVGRLDRVLSEQASEYDNVVIDTPPGRSLLQMAALVAGDEIICPVECAPMGLEGWVAIDEQIREAREKQTDHRRRRLLEYRCVVPTKYREGEQISDGIVRVLGRYEHPDYEGLPLPVSEPIPRSTIFEKCTTPRSVPTNGGTWRRALTIWEAAGEDIARRAGDAYMALARLVDAYA